MKSFITSFKYTSKIFFRVKTALFFSMMFPVLLLIIFGSVFGGENSNYYYILLSGLVAMNVASVGLFSVAPVIISYHQSKSIKLLNVLPLNIVSYFLGLIANRVFMLWITIGVLAGLSTLFFGFVGDLLFYIRLLTGATLGVLFFSFIGLVLVLYNIRMNGSDSETYKSFINIIFYIMLFMSDTFYPTSQMNPALEFVLSLNPLTYVLAFFREGDTIAFLILALGSLSFCLFFNQLFKKVSFAR